jgi:hypothetical protein
MTNAEAAQLIARMLGPVLPLCYARNGACACSGRYDRALGKLVPHDGHDISKAPISKLARNGVDDATRNSAAIDRNWRQEPDAGVGLDLEAAGLIFIDPDSPAAYAEAVAQGVEGGMLRTSRNDGFLFKRPADWPVINITKSADGTDLEIRTTGYVVAWNTHQDGSQVRVDLTTQLQDGPGWAGERLKRKAAEKAAQDAVRDARRAERTASEAGSEPPVRLHARGLRRWIGELVQCKENGDIDHSESLYFIGLDLAECGAAEGSIATALAERDTALGWNTYTDRKDDREYERIAEKVVAYVVEREKAPQLRITKPADVPDDVAALRAALEAAEARIAHLERALMDRDDRLDVIEPIITQIDEILARPEVETDDDGNITRYGPTSDDKLVDIGCARFMPHWRAKKKANGEPPTIALGYLSKVLGMPSRRVSRSLERQSSDDPNDGAPFRKQVTRRYLEDEQRWESTLEVIPWGDSPAATLRAAATYALPARPKHGGSKAAADMRWGRCDKHDNQDVRVRGFCPDCGQVVGERIVTLAEFDALNVQLGHSETAPPTVSVNSIDVQVGHSDPAHRDPERLKVQVVDSDTARAAAMVGIPLTRDVDTWKRLASRDRPEPANLGQIRMARHQKPQERPKRCPAPDCHAMEFRPLPDGSWRCLKSSHDPSDYELAAVSGGAE